MKLDWLLEAQPKSGVQGFSVRHVRHFNSSIRFVVKFQVVQHFEFLKSDLFYRSSIGKVAMEIFLTFSIVSAANQRSECTAQNAVIGMQLAQAMLINSRENFLSLEN